MWVGLKQSAENLKIKSLTNAPTSTQTNKKEFWQQTAFGFKLQHKPHPFYLASLENSDI